jgi:hypothetical protein
MCYLVSAGTTNFTVGLWSDPAGTPTLVTNGSASVDPQILNASSMRSHLYQLPEAVTVEANTDYLVGCLQNSATNLSVSYFSVAELVDLLWTGFDSTCYAAKSTAGAAVAAQNSGKRRAGFFVRISAIEFPSGGGMLVHPGMNGRLSG